MQVSPQLRKVILFDLHTHPDEPDWVIDEAARRASDVFNIPFIAGTGEDDFYMRSPSTHVSPCDEPAGVFKLAVGWSAIVLVLLRNVNTVVQAVALRSSLLPTAPAFLSWICPDACVHVVRETARTGYVLQYCVWAPPTSTGHTNGCRTTRTGR